MKPTITKILVPLDFSTTSDAALDFARTVARSFGASLHLLHVFEDPVLATGFAEAYAPLPPDTRAALIDDAGRQLANRLSGEDREQFRATTDVISGLSAMAIVEYAQDHDIDLIVMGTHGRTGMAHLVIGSVAERVVRLAKCPVLTVRADKAVLKQAERAYLPEMPTQIPA
jgi:nucleotide-binding universal stress UspA family protein